MLIYLCSNEPESILSAIYEAWADPCPNHDIQLQIEEENLQISLFAEYKKSSNDLLLAQKVLDSIHYRLSDLILGRVKEALMADAADKAQAIFQFLRIAFSTGPSAAFEYGRPEVMRLYELCRMVGKETDHLKGFIRFAQTKDKILIGTFTPKHRQAALLAPFFADRFSNESFFLYDKTYREAAVYSRDTHWFIVRGDNCDPTGRIQEAVREAEADQYADLWSVFFKSIAIEARKNPRCQQNMLPLRFRPDMTEFRRYS